MRIWVLAVLLGLAGCAGRPVSDSTLGPMLAVRLATAAAVQDDPARAARVVAECDALLAKLDSGESLALDALAAALNTRIAESGMPPAERAVLSELVAVAAVAVQGKSVLPEDSRARLRVVLGWVRAAALARVSQAG